MSSTNGTNSVPTTMSRQEYASLFGPTVGDKVRLGDTDLYIEIERDLRVYGDEALYGGGKTLRDGMGMDNQVTNSAGALDLVITNVVVIDPLLGVLRKCGRGWGGQRPGGKRSNWMHGCCRSGSHTALLRWRRG